jgi:hypothetical protein
MFVTIIIILILILILSAAIFEFADIIGARRTLSRHNSIVVVVNSFFRSYNANR